MKERNRLVLQAKINITARRNLKVSKKRKKLKVHRRKIRLLFLLQVQVVNKKQKRKVKRFKIHDLVSIQRMKWLKSQMENEKIQRRRKSKKKKLKNLKNSCRSWKPLKRSMKICMRTVKYQNGSKTWLNFTKTQRIIKMSSLRITFKIMFSHL